MRFDTIVIGAGPAGAMAARRAAMGGARVAIVERCALPREKICGQFHHGRVRDELAKAGLGEMLRALEAYSIPDFGVHSGARGFVAPLGVAGFALCRSRLDHALTKAACESGATLFAPCEAAPTRDDDTGRWCVEHEGSSIEAPTLIVAEGRGSAFLARRFVRIDRREPATVAFQGVFKLRSESAPRVELHVFPWGYAGVLAMGPREANFCPVVRTDRLAGLGLSGGPAGMLKGLLEIGCRESPALRERFEGAEPPGSIHTSRFVSTARPASVFGDRWLLAGDAAGASEPFLGEGIWRAIVSGELAGAAAARIAAGEDFGRAAGSYRRDLRAAFRAGERQNAFLRPAMFSGFVAKGALGFTAAAPGLARGFAARVTR